MPLLHHQYPRGGIDIGSTISFGAAKALRICEALRNALPPHDELLFLLSKGGQWWDHWHQKTFGNAIRHETLTEYAIRVYGENSPADLGMLVSAFARHTDIDPLRLMSIIDQVVIGDDQYAGTLSGLILIAFQTKNYLDAGQPRRAFLCNRRGLNLCQLMVNFTMCLSPRNNLTRNRISIAPMLVTQNSVLSGGLFFKATAFCQSCWDCRTV